jgi:hypothetical protein
MTYNDLSRCVVESEGARLRAHGVNADTYRAQSAGVAFGLLPERQVDIESLARATRSGWPIRGARPVQ